MANNSTLAARLKEILSSYLESCTIQQGEVTIEVQAMNLIKVARYLIAEPDLEFKMLIDLCAVDYSTYGQDEWSTLGATNNGFSRAVTRAFIADAAPDKRYAVVYHLLSVSQNQRLRMRVFVPDDELPQVDSVAELWPSANWYEREAFDVMGIVFEGHPDLRRILTDYGFVGHPFRKDFPLIGEVEMRYDPEKQRVVYEPVSIEPRVLVPRVIRHDHRFDLKAQERQEKSAAQDESEKNSNA